MKNYFRNLVTGKRHVDFAEDQIEAVDKQINELQNLADHHRILSQTYQDGVNRLRSPAVAAQIKQIEGQHPATPIRRSRTAS